MNKARLLALPGLALVFASLAAEPAVPVDARDLGEAPQPLVGKRVSVHGCLVFAPPHDQYIHPCGSNEWRYITLVRDDNFVGVEAYGKTLMGKDVEGDFVGTMIQVAVDRPGKGKRTFLKLESVRNVAPMSPNNSFKPKPLRGSA